MKSADHRIENALLRWFVPRVYIIYVLGLVLWLVFSIVLPPLIGPPVASPLHLVIGYALLFLNLFSAYNRRYEDENVDSDCESRYEFEADRVRFIQEYGTAIILPAAVTAAFTTARTPQLIWYLGASITVAVIALVPIWVTRVDWRPLFILRHFKTVVVIWGAAWLVEAVRLVLSSPR